MRADFYESSSASTFLHNAQAPPPNIISYNVGPYLIGLCVLYTRASHTCLDSYVYVRVALIYAHFAIIVQNRIVPAAVCPACYAKSFVMQMFLQVLFSTAHSAFRYGILFGFVVGS